MWLHPRGAEQGTPGSTLRPPTAAHHGDSRAHRSWHIPALPAARASTLVQPSSDSRGRSQPVSGINISCAQAVHLTLFCSSAPDLHARSNEFSSATPSAAPAPCHHRRQSIACPARDRCLSLHAGCGQLQDGEENEDGVSPGCRWFGVTLLSPLRFGVGGGDGEKEAAAGTRLCAAPRSAPYYPR